MSQDPADGDVGQATLAVTGGRAPMEHFGYVNPPVYHGSTILFANARAYRDQVAPYTYGRAGGPTHVALETAVAALEGGYRTRLAPSGKAAVYLALLSALKSGDHLLMTDTVYRPTRMTANTLLARFGVETSYFDPHIGGDIDKLIRPNTAVVFTESPGSQTFEIMDIPAISAAAHAKGVLVMFDNTWASPLYFKPFEHGVDISVQAGTKYIGGHSDIMLGCVTTTKQCWQRLNDTYLDTGTSVGPDDVYLAQRGLRTIEVRLARQMQSGIAIARWLETRDEVARVLHPALESHPDHALWKRDFLGASSLFSIVLKPVAERAVDAFLDSLKLFAMGDSWGGYESLVVPFNPSRYRTATIWDAPGPALRFHIGLETVDDLQADLAHGFAAMASAQ